MVTRSIAFRTAGATFPSCPDTHASNRKPVAQHPYSLIQGRLVTVAHGVARRCKQSVSASGPNSLPIPESTRCLMISAPGDPPGSRVTMSATLRRSDLGEHFDVRGFAGALATLKSDESSRPGVLLTAASPIVRVSRRQRGNIR